MRTLFAVALCVGLLVMGSGVLQSATAADDDFSLQLRHQRESSAGSGRYHRLSRGETWKASETAVIVCDVWDFHHCLNAVRREGELAPRLNDVLIAARQRGATIIHSPSGCMDAYMDHPARRRAMQAPPSKQLPDDIQSWCSRIPAEEQGKYPIDQSDGGEDDDPAEHAAWAAKLKAMGRNPKAPWKKQLDVIEIDSKRDYISDRGDEVWNILQQRGIKNVILTGVHTNMCVLGRPFGLRQMARNGKNVVLMRDMTDTMYNPQRWPYVSHFTGTDLIVAHIEKFVCPTITSDQVIGGETFRFSGDKRPHLVIVMAEDEYKTNETLPKFAVDELGKQFRVSFVFGSDTERHALPGIDALDDADVALFSVRRRWLPTKAMRTVRRFVESGKPVVGMRTASHAFEVRNKPAPDGYRDWPEFDAVVFGGNYHGHLGNKLTSRVEVVSDNADHPILMRFTPKPFQQGGSLYEASPLVDGTTVLLTGKAEGHPAEPVAWTFRRADKGRSIYTSLGQVDDFSNPQFLGFFRTAISWAAGLPAEAKASGGGDATSRNELPNRHWSLTTIPVKADSRGASVLRAPSGPVWLRSAVRLPSDWIQDDLSIELAVSDSPAKLWCNGHAAGLQPTGASDARPVRRRTRRWTIDPRWLETNDANLIVVRTESGDAAIFERAPVVVSGKNRLKLEGHWQFRIGDDPAWSNMPLPAKFGVSTDIVFQP